ncbi:glycosyltransferase family 2 protein [Salinimicrobium sediminilitoris]|uniref:glycosyltransferase family 2 protein n=1 Tax=Salinimicrobium sediminilitoris TaxID=2876715 RepID=UPI001E3E72AD|nr:glycosyltransferase family A protein [Salinimicrobium sediminilitoris]MCC8358526.1 glycosyltransferase family 2 protein [Salinimicrobium sediminilitoris]
MAEAKVAIILTSHNREKLIEETLVSIQNQTFTKFHCYIIDDFSTDNTPAVVKRFVEKDDRFCFFKKPEAKSKGLSASRNMGLDLIKEKEYDYLQFFDDDDLMHPRKLEVQIKNLEKNPTSQFSLCGAQNFTSLKDINFELNSENNTVLEYELWDAYLIGKIKFVAQVPIFRSSFFSNYRFDEELHYAEEWVLFVQQFYNEKPVFSNVEDTLFYRRKHSISITSGGNRNFNVRKTSAIAGIKVLDFLSQNNIHTRTSILHYLRYFLLYNYDSGILKEIEKELKINFPELMPRFWMAKKYHWISRKIILRTLKY